MNLASAPGLPELCRRLRQTRRAATDAGTADGGEHARALAQTGIQATALSVPPAGVSSFPDGNSQSFETFESTVLQSDEQRKFRNSRASIVVATLK